MKELEKQFTDIFERNHEVKLIDALKEADIHIISGNCWCCPTTEHVENLNASA